MKKRTGLSAIIVISIAFMLSSFTTYAATMECADAYMEVEEKTAVADAVGFDIVDKASAAREDLSTSSNAQYSGLTMEYGDSHKVICMEGEVEEDVLRGATAFNWDLPIGCRIYGPWFDCTTDMEVLVSAMFNPLYVTIRVGLEDEWGYRYYAESTDNLTFRFQFPNNRKYRIYVENNTHTEASVSGSYITR